jgi:hypothetical protein
MSDVPIRVLKALVKAAKEGRDITIFGVRYEPKTRGCSCCKHMKAETCECEILKGMPLKFNSLINCKAFEWSDECEEIGYGGVRETSDELAQDYGWQCYKNGSFTWFRDSCPLSDTPMCPAHTREGRKCEMSEFDEGIVSNAYERWAKERWGEGIE